MTARSPKGGRRPFDPTRFDGYSPVGANACRDTLINNIVHSADEANAKVLVNWNAPDPALITGTPQTYVTGDLEAAATWYHIGSYGPYGLNAFADGTPYTLVCELEAASSVAATAVRVAIQVGAYSVSPTSEIYGSGTNSLRWDTSSATRAWLTSTAATNLIVPSRASFVPPGVWETTDDAGGEPREVLQCNVWINVFGYSAGGVAEPRIYGMHVREYVA